MINTTNLSAGPGEAHSRTRWRRSTGVTVRLTNAAGRRQMTVSRRLSGSDDVRPARQIGDLSHPRSFRVTPIPSE